MKKSKGVLGFGVILIMAIALLCTQRTYAQGTYKWVDEKGNMHFTDDPGVVPQKEWAKMKRDTIGHPARPHGDSPGYESHPRRPQRDSRRQ